MQFVAAAATTMQERGGLVIALELLKQHHAQEVEWRVRGDILADLLSLEPADEPRILARARAYGRNLTQPHVVLVARPDTLDAEVRGPGLTMSEEAQQHVIACARHRQQRARPTTHRQPAPKRSSSSGRLRTKTVTLQRRLRRRSRTTSPRGATGR
jgi:hypothetical protein